MAIAQKNVYPILAPRGGLNFSLPADQIGDTEMSDCQNVYCEEGFVKKRYGYGTLGGNLPLDGPIIGSDQFYTYDGNSSLLVATTGGLYYLASASSSPYWETLMSNEVEDDCETNWTASANVTSALDSSDKKVGSNSVKLTIAAAFTTGLAAYHDQSIGDKSAYGMARFWIKSDIATAAGDLQLIISNNAGCSTEDEALDIPALTAGTWRLCFVQCSGKAAPNSIDSIGIKVITDNGAQVVRIDDIRLTSAWDNSVAYNTTTEDTISADYMRKSDQTDLWWIMTNGVDVPQYWTGNTATALAALISTPPSGITTMVAKQLVEFKEYLLLMDVTLDGNRYPQRIFWSDTGNPTDFDSGNASYQDLTGSDWLQAAIKFKGDYIVVLKERSIWLGYATGDTSAGSNIFQFDQKVSGAGCAAPNTVESLGDEIIFLGWDNVYVFDGIDYIPIGDEIRDELFDRINPTQIPKSFGVIVEEQYEYWLFVASTNSNYPDMAWVFNYNLNKWTKHIVYDSDGNGAYMSFYGYYELQATKTIGDLVGSIGQQTWRIGDRTVLEAAPITLLCDTNGYVYQYDRLLNNDNGTAIDAWFSTKDFNPTQLTQRWNLTRIDAYFTGAGMDLEYSTDKGETWTQITSFTRNDDLETPQTYYCRLNLLMVRLRCRNAVSGEHFEFSRMNLYWRPAGRRL